MKSSSPEAVHAPPAARIAADTTGDRLVAHSNQQSRLEQERDSGHKCGSWRPILQTHFSISAECSGESHIAVPAVQQPQLCVLKQVTKPLWTIIEGSDNPQTWAITGQKEASVFFFFFPQCHGLKPCLLGKHTTDLQLHPFVHLVIPSLIDSS